MRRVLYSLPITALFAVLTFLSLPSVPADIASWSGVLAWVDGPVWRWALPIIGWIGMAVTVGWSLHRSRRPQRVIASSVSGDREHLRAWLGEKIEEIQGFRSALDGEASKPVPVWVRTRRVESMFEQLNMEVTRRLHAAAPEWSDFWDERPVWFEPRLNRLMPDEVAELSRYYGWIAERIRHIKMRLA